MSHGGTQNSYFNCDTWVVDCNVFVFNPESSILSVALCALCLTWKSNSKKIWFSTWFLHVGWWWSAQHKVKIKILCSYKATQQQLALRIIRDLPTHWKWIISIYVKMMHKWLEFFFMAPSFDCVRTVPWPTFFLAVCWFRNADSSKSVLSCGAGRM